MSKTSRIKIAVNAVLPVAVIAAVIILFLCEDGAVKGFKYYTVLSNLFVAVAAVVYLLSRGRGRFTAVIKHVSAVAIAVTFLVVVAFFWPVFGPDRLFNSYNILFHIIIPLIAVGEEIFLPSACFDFRDDLLSALPPLVYGAAYLANLLINGVKENDWYGFVTWGIPTGIVIFAVICFVTVLVSAIIRRLAKKGKCENGR